MAQEVTETETELMHFTKSNVLYHAYYSHRAWRGGVSWAKVYGSEKPCECSDRENDRRALLGIRREP